ncbi:hypothetical protein KC867_00875 [Candidatus Saccharibacteria bacterium]|nr:hypothetical protein [Candidatus Saccharibacteria bacterium]
MHYHKISDKLLKEFKDLCKKEGIHYDTDEEYRRSAQNLVGLVDLLIEIDMKDRQLKNRLKDEPKGFSLEGKGRSCSLCHRSVYENDGWYDKWGFKCMNCQDAVNKKKIPGSICGDWNNEKSVTDSTLAWKGDLHVQTIRKLIRQGKLKARAIPNGPYILLRKDNPDLLNVIDKEKIKVAKKKQTTS